MTVCTVHVSSSTSEAIVWVYVCKSHTDQLSERQSNPDVFSPVALFALKLCQFFGMPLCSPKAKPRLCPGTNTNTQTHTKSHSLPRFLAQTRTGGAT